MGWNGTIIPGLWGCFIYKLMIVKHCINANCLVWVSKVLQLYLNLAKEKFVSCQAEFIHYPSETMMEFELHWWQCGVAVLTWLWKGLHSYSQGLWLLALLKHVYIPLVIIKPNEWNESTVLTTKKRSDGFLNGM